MWKPSGIHSEKEKSMVKFFSNMKKGGDPFCPYLDKNTKKCLKNNSETCPKLVREGYDNNKKTVLLLDDNPGMISILKDDFENFDDEDLLDLSEFNILSFDTKFAGINFIEVHENNPELKIDYAILDITLGGSVSTVNGLEKVTGVDVFEVIYKRHPYVKVLFYTGNNLNKDIKSNKKLFIQFAKLTDGQDLQDYTIFKTSLSMDERRKLFLTFLKDN